MLGLDVLRPTTWVCTSMHFLRIWSYNMDSSPVGLLVQVSLSYDMSYGNGALFILPPYQLL